MISNNIYLLYSDVKNSDGLAPTQVTDVKNSDGLAPIQVTDVKNSDGLAPIQVTDVKNSDGLAPTQVTDGVSIAKTMESNLKAYSYNHKYIYTIISFYIICHCVAMCIS